MNARCDVLVVGGGPVGACAAQALAADGASVTLIEKEAAGLPAGQRGARQLWPSAAELRHAPGRTRRAGPWAALVARQLEPLLHRPAPQWRPSALALAVPRRRDAGESARRRACAARLARSERRPARRARSVTAASAGSTTATAIVQVYETPAAMDEAAEEADVARELGVRADMLEPRRRPRPIPRPSRRARRRPLLPRRRAYGPGALHARDGRQGGGRRRRGASRYRGHRP